MKKFLGGILAAFFICGTAYADSGWYPLTHAPSLYSDTIYENTTDHGVIVDGVTLKDGGVTGAGDHTVYDATNNGNPQLRLGATDAEELHIQSVYDSGAQTLNYVEFITDVASATADKGKYVFDVDGTDILTIDDGGLELTGGVGLSGTIIGVTTAITGTANNALSISVPDQPDSGNAAGKGITIQADKAGEKTGGVAAGGAVTINAGDAGGDTGNANGGDITLSPGEPVNSGTHGNVIIPVDHALKTDTINETTTNAGVTIDGAKVIDGSVLLEVVAKGTIALTVTDAGVVTCDATAGDVTYTLPDAAGNTGLNYIVKKITATNNCIIDGLDADSLDGAATISLAGQWTFKHIVSDGTNWLVIGSNAL